MSIYSLLKKTKGFTLIELLIVIAIIAILTVAFLPTLRGGQASARDAAKVALLSDLSTSLENEINNGNNAPVSVPATGGCVSDFTVAPGSTLATALSRVPQSFPALTSGGGFGQHLCSTATYSTFWYWSGGTSSYALAIEVENAKNANVKQGFTKAQLTSGATMVNSLATLIAATNTPVGTGETVGGISQYYYVIAK